MSNGVEPTFLWPGGPQEFPDPCAAPAEGLVAVGGDLSVERLVAAYSNGIFPWYEDGVPPCWWSPEPRAVLPMDQLHVSRSLRRTIRRGGFDLSWNRAFRDVMLQSRARRADGVWIIDQMVSAYVDLFEAGHAHSFEVWWSGELVGGLYGVQVGRLFAAESMFHRRTDMSKVALVAAVRTLLRRGIELFDVQFLTDHLASFGALEWPRQRYVAAARAAARRPLSLEERQIVAL